MKYKNLESRNLNHTAPTKEQVMEGLLAVALATGAMGAATVTENRAVL